MSALADALTRLAQALRARWRGNPEAVLLCAAAALLAMALLRPTLPVREQLVNALVVIDITQSMNVPDGRWGSETVTRIELARRGAADLMRSVPCGSRIGLGVFNEYRTFVLLAPLEVCANFHELQATLERIGNRMSWAGASEIAKGINSGLQACRELADKPAFVMFTDGHEAPPISLLHRPKIKLDPGELGGVLVGTGSLRPQPIPKFDPNGAPLGYWKADEVAQTDIYSQGRQSSVPGEKYAEDPADAQAAKPEPKAKPPGTEHLSALHEEYLEQLAGELGLGYLRLEGPGRLAAALHANHGTTPARVPGDLRWLLALAALLALLASHLGWDWPRRLARPVVSRITRWRKLAGHPP